MGFLSINNLDSTQGTVFFNKPKSVASVRDSGSIMTTSLQAQETTSPCDSKYKRFFDALASSRLKNGKLLGERDMLINGFKKSPIMDMNGGTYYKKGEETFRLGPDITHDGWETVTYSNNNLSHQAVYDAKGKEVSGVIKIHQSDGTTKVYNYEVDVEGNRYIKSISSSNDN